MNRTEDLAEEMELEVIVSYGSREGWVMQSWENVISKNESELYCYGLF